MFTRSIKGEVFCYGLIISLVMMYGLIPFSVHILGLRNIEWAYANLNYSLVLVFIISILVFSKPLPLPTLGLVPKSEVGNFFIAVIFTLAVIIFYHFPWHDDRVSVGSQFAAVFRAIWLYLVFSCRFSSEFKRSTVLICTLVLMFIDQSRTTFLLAIFFLAYLSKYKAILLPTGILLGIILAAVRMSKSHSILTAVWFGIFGEAYNGAYPVGQVLQLDINIIDIWVYVTQVVFQPIIYVMFKLVSLIVPDLSDLTAQGMLASQVRSELGERLAPMGGWYLPASFIHLGPFTGIFMATYVYSIYIFSKFLFQSKEFPYHLLFLFVAIKATPSVYINFCLYYGVVFFILKQIGRVRI